jgi:hypothetical protein
MNQPVASEYLALPRWMLFPNSVWIYFQISDEFVATHKNNAGAIQIMR